MGGKEKVPSDRKGCLQVASLPLSSNAKGHTRLPLLPPSQTPAKERKVPLRIPI